MSKARVSIIVYGAYLATAGLVLALVPNVLLTMVRLPEDHGFWVRLAGALAFVLGIKGIHNSSAENPHLSGSIISREPLLQHSC